MTITLYPTPEQKNAINTAEDTGVKELLYLCWVGLLASYGYSLCHGIPTYRSKEKAWIVTY